MGTMYPVSSLTVRPTNWNCYRHPTWRPSPARLASTRSFLISRPVSTKFAGGMDPAPRYPWIKTYGSTWRILPKPSARKCPQTFSSPSQTFLAPQWKSTSMARVDFQFLCARISNFPVDNGLGMDLYPVKIRAIQGHSQAALKSAGGLYAKLNHGVMLRPCCPRAKSRLHRRAHLCHDWGPWRCVPSHDEKQLEEHRTERPDPRRRWLSQQRSCPQLHVGAPHRHRWVQIWIKSKMSSRSQNCNAARSWSWCHL